RRFGAWLPVTDTGPTAEEEISLFRQRLRTIRDDLEAANRKYKSIVSVSAILLDCERFVTSLTEEPLNEAITRKENQVYEVAKSIFPEARVEWYGRGGMHVSSDASGWTQNRYFTLAEKGDSFACSLYQLPDDSKMRETYRRTVELARTRGVAEVTPWIALGTGWERRGWKNVWEWNWDYDLKYSWQLGVDINNRSQAGDTTAPWDAAKVVVLFPSPFDEASPASFEHFVAYVRGAAGQPENDHHRVPICSRQASKVIHGSVP